jgi:hypothetical protein
MPRAVPENLSELFDSSGTSRTLLDHSGDLSRQSPSASVKEGQKEQFIPIKVADDASGFSPMLDRRLDGSFLDMPPQRLRLLAVVEPDEDPALAPRAPPSPRNPDSESAQSHAA